MATELLPDTGVNLVTAAELAALPDPADGSRTELVRGEVVTMSPPSFVHGYVQANICSTLHAFVRRAKSGRVTVESGVLTELGPDTVRGPDVAYWSFARLPADRTPKVFAEVGPELVAEVVSPSNTRRHIAAKVREYFALGTVLVWVAEPEDRTVTEYRKPGDGKVYWDDATLTADGVLPGFSCPVAEFFD